MHDCAPRALLKFLDMGYEGPDPGTPGPVIRGNPTLLREMVANLVDNAINYTPSSQEVPGVITTRLLVDPFSRAVVLQIEDSGPGIAQAERELVFRPFYRALGTRMDGSGFGLGWAVTTDVTATTQPGSEGTYSWGGMASTFFWIDPAEDLIAIQMTQLMPSASYPIRPQLQQLVYAAIID